MPCPTISTTSWWRRSLHVFFAVGLLMQTIQPNLCLTTKSPTPSAPKDATTTLSTTSPSSYYSYKTFKKMGVPAMLYSTVAKVAGRLVRLSHKEIPSSSTASESTTGNDRRKVALITGSNTGVGFATAKTLVQDHGFEVIIASRDQKKGIQACQTINAYHGDGGDNNHNRGMAVFVETLDLSNFTSVQVFCNQVQEQYDTIDVLINNAGVNSAGATDAHNNTPSTPTASPNLDVIFQTNFLGHFLLTNLLLDKCQRIVNLSSVMHHFPVYSKKDTIQDISSPDYWKRNALSPDDKAVDSAEDDEDKDVRKPYSASKLASLLFSVELYRRYSKSKGIQAIAVNPGSVNSDIWRNYSSVKKALFQRIYLTPEQGSATSVAASVLDFGADSGVENTEKQSTFYLQPYWIPFQKKNKTPYPLFEMLGPYRGYCVTQPRLPEDGGLAASKTLFDVCEELVGVKFPVAEA